MEERHFVLYWNEHTDERKDRNEVIKTFRAEEILADGKRKTVYSDICFQTNDISPALHSVFKRVVPKQSKRRVWRAGRRAA